MSEIRLSIAGRNYTVACAPGEEEHIADLGAAIDSALIQKIPELAPQESQNLLFAALIQADELHELRQQMKGNADTLKTHDDVLKKAEKRAEKAQSARKDIQSELDALKKEKDALLKQLNQATAKIDKLNADATKRASNGGAKSGAAGGGDDVLLLDKESELFASANALSGKMGGSAVELKPALEQFATLLESCADRLEGQRSNA